MGLFMGAIINANIFGELSLIFSQLNERQLVFQTKMSKANTAMINFHLPHNIRQDVRHHMYSNQPMMQFQETIKTFFTQLKPSLSDKILSELFRGVFKSQGTFGEMPAAVEELLQLIRISFYASEQTIME